MTYWERLLAEYIGGGDSPISPTLIAKSITTNGTYNAVDDEADGYSSVSVNVPNTSTLKGNLPLTFKTSEEQLRDWTIYGNNYEHTYSAEGTLPLTFTTHTAGAASDWVIYGNDDNGTENFFQTTATSSSGGGFIFAVNNDGSITVTGTSARPTTHFFVLGQISVPAGTYTITGCPNGGSWGGSNPQTYCTSVQVAGIGTLYETGDGVTVTAQSETTIKLIITLSTSLSNIDLTYKPMLVKGSTAPDHYIPYQQGVGERTAQLFDKTTVTEGYRIAGDGAPYPDPRCKLSDYIEVLPNTTYSVNTNFTYDDAMAQYDESKTFIERTVSGSEPFTTTSSTKYVRISMLNDNANTKMLVEGSTAPASYIPYGYEIPLTINDTPQTFYIGTSPLTSGQSISKTSTGVDIAAIAGSNTITTELFNKPSMTITGLDYVGVGEPTNDGWQIPLTVSDGTNATTVNVPIDAPLASTDSISSVVDIPTYVGTNTIDTTLIKPITADIVYVGANSTLINKTVNQNGTYFAYSDNTNGYNSVAVDVPNTYTNEDESKVVSNGELVTQTTTSVTTNGIVDTTTISSVSVNVPTAGSTTGDVRFLDYDGTVVQAYSKSEFASLTALPANPAHEGLTAQGWNWSLEDAKTYVAAYDKLDIGQMYITNDGKTRLYVTLDDGRLNPTLAIAVDGSCDVDWGDGTTHDTLTGTSLSSRVAASHTYATGGDYVIALTVTGSFTFAGGSNGSLLFTYNDTGNDNRSKGYRNILRGVEIGDGITTINRYAFANCLALSSITIPDSVTSIEDNVFNTCIALSSITIPDNVASVAAYAFDSCYSLSSITIPKSVTLIGGDAFRYCYTLSSVTIPSSVTRIGVDVFRYCYALSSVTIPNSVTEIGSYAFDSCYSLSSVIIPNSVTTIEGSAFGLCRTLVNVTIPNSITSINAYTFSGCATLPSITIPASVTSIGGNAFASCGSLSSIVFQSETPPEIASSSAFYNVPDDCIIYVPTGTLADYTSASNYPSSSTYTYVEY